jgi:predicted amidohydrolase YtcJ
MSEPPTILFRNVCLLPDTLETLKARGEGGQNVLLEHGELQLSAETRESEDKLVTVDGKGGTLLPGFVDCHTHFFHFARSFMTANLAGAGSVEESLERAQSFLETQERPPDRLVAMNFDESGWEEKRYPVREELDRISADIPVLFKRVCGHMAVTNTRGLELLQGLEGSDSFKDFVNAEKGHLREKAAWELTALLRAGVELEQGALEKAISHFSSLGITGIHDIVSLEDLERYDKIVQNLDFAPEDLPLDVSCYLLLPDRLEEFEPKAMIKVWEQGMMLVAGLQGALAGSDSQSFLSLSGIKLFLDGSFGARTAALLEDYADQPGNRGKLLHSELSLIKVLAFCYDQDCELMAHLIGDRALEQLLEALERFNRYEREEWPLRVRLEHLELLPDQFLERLKALDPARVKLTLSMMPNFAGNWSTLPDGMNVCRLGKERFRDCERFKAALDSGIPLVFGSDCMPPGPLYGVLSAVFNPNVEERLSLMEALRAYTGPRELLENEEDLSLVLLSHDISTLQTEEELKKVRVTATVSHGRLVYKQD